MAKLLTVSNDDFTHILSITWRGGVSSARRGSLIETLIKTPLILHVRRVPKMETFYEVNTKLTSKGLASAIEGVAKRIGPSGSALHYYIVEVRSLPYHNVLKL